MDANPMPADVPTVPAIAIPVKPDGRRWSTDEQRIYLDSKQPEYLKAKTIVGGAMLFFRMIDTEFLTHWSPRSLVEQFNQKPMGPPWNAECPSISQDFSILRLNDIPDAEIVKSGPQDSTLTRIRKRLRSYFNNHNKRKVGLTLTTAKGSKKRQRSHTSHELFSKDHYSSFRDVYEPRALMLVKKTNLIQVLTKALIDTSQLCDIGRIPTPESLAQLEALAAAHSLKPAPPAPVHVRNTATALAFEDLPSDDQQRWNDAAEAEKAASAAARQAAKTEEKRKKLNPKSAREPISNEVLKHNLVGLPVHAHQFLESVVSQTGHTCFLIIAGPDGEGHLATEMICHGATNPNEQTFMDAYPDFEARVERPFREYALTCYKASQVLSHDAQRSTASVPSSSTSTASDAGRPLVRGQPVSGEPVHPAAGSLAELGRNVLGSTPLSIPQPLPPPSVQVDANYDHSIPPGYLDFTASALDDSQRSGLFKSLLESHDYSPPFATQAAPTSSEPPVFYSANIFHDSQRSFGGQSAHSPPPGSFSQALFPVDSRQRPSYGGPSIFNQPIAPFSSQTLPLTPAYPTVPRIGGHSTSWSLNHPISYPPAVYQLVHLYGQNPTPENLHSASMHLNNVSVNQDNFGNFGSFMSSEGAPASTPLLDFNLPPASNGQNPPAWPSRMPDLQPPREQAHHHTVAAPGHLSDCDAAQEPEPEPEPEPQASFDVHPATKRKRKPKAVRPRSKKNHQPLPPSPTEELPRRPVRRIVVAAQQDTLSPLLQRLIQGLRGVCMGESADFWDRLVLALRELEIKIVEEDPKYTKKLKPYDDLPVQLVTWMSEGYDFSRPVKILEEDAKEYSDKWLGWWKAVQPDGPSAPSPSTGRDGRALSALRCGGEHGLIALTLGLFHWGCSSKELTTWQRAFDDFRATILALSLA